MPTTIPNARVARPAIPATFSNERQKKYPSRMKVADQRPVPITL